MTKLSATSVTRAPEIGEVSVNGADIRYYDWGGTGPPIVLAHGTGFHSRCWDATIDLLGDAHVVAVDHRGHGQSSQTPPFDWAVLGADLAAVITALDLHDILGVGHSMGAHVLLQAASALSDRFTGVIAIDPIICAPEDYAKAKPMTDVHPASKRRDVWASPDAMYESFKDREPFCRWRPQILRDYCEHGLVATPNGAFRLACPPSVEASIYGGDRQCDITGLAATLDLPVTVMRAGIRPVRSGAPKNAVSPFWPGLAAHMRNATDVYLPERAHAIPMEDPEIVAAHIARMRGA
ncbi:MAG: alpha/beta fold hydrolase [Alphaproteobacteria bacterium]|jgi:pimeloyl-ACP methyl ester carboxylesterase